ncbi:MAG: hypothetical protein ACYC36_02410 [Bellilinea sp.]
MTENTQIEQTPEDLEIANAFAEFAGDAAAPAAQPAVENTTAKGEKTPEELAAETVAATTPDVAATAGEKTPEELAAEAAANAKTPEESAAETAAAEAATTPSAPVEDPRIAELQAAIEALKPKEAPTPAAPIYSAEEEAALKKYSEDWPDIQKGEALARRAEYQELVGYIFQQVRQELEKVETKYAPALEYTQHREVHDQYSEIKALVPDYDAVRDKTLAWIDTQPTWLQAAYTKVANEGTPDEVAGLIGLYKKETGYVAPVAAQAPAAKPAAAISPAAQQAAAKLAVVKTNRTEAGNASEESFDNSFAAYAAEEEKRLSRK